MAGLAVTQGLLMLSHNTAAALFPAALNAGVLAEWVRRTTAAETAEGLRALDEERFWHGWLAVQAAALLIWLPWGPAFWRQMQTVYGDFWIQPPTGYGVWLAFHNFNLAFPQGWFPGSPWWDLLYWGLAGLGLWALWRQGAAAALLATLFLLPALLELALSLRRPIFSDRTLIWTTLPYYLLIGAGLAQLWEGRPQGSPLRAAGARGEEGFRHGVLDGGRRERRVWR